MYITSEMPRYTKKGKTTKKTKKYTPKVSNKVKDYVQKAIKVASENKIAASDKENNLSIIPYNAVVAAAPPTIISTIIRCHGATDLTQGSGQGDRVGNSVKPVKLIMRGHITNFSTHPILVRMIFYREKETFEIPFTMTDFIQEGNTSTNPGNTPVDMYRPLNKDSYKIYKQKRFSLSAQSAVSNNEGFSAIKFFSYDLTKYLPKVCKYNDNADEITNGGIYCGFLMCTPTSAPLDPDTDRVVVSYNIDFEFEE